jgi:hypothetical protein
VLSERIRTRIQQGAGRATRNARDFAAVIIRSDSLTDFLARDEELRAMPAQLQAEIEFGFVNAESPDVDFLALLRSFWAQDADWQAAEAELRVDTGQRERIVGPAEQALAASAAKEVLCWRAVFTDDLESAIALAQEVTDLLIGGEELRPYRALWFYLASSWAWHLAGTNPGRWREQARELQREASGCAATLRWTPRWLAEPHADVEPASSSSRPDRAAAMLHGLGIRGSRFEAHLRQLEEKLGSDDASAFEQGLELFGALLGFEALRPSGQAAPDGAWRDDSHLWLVFEAKTEERADTPLSAETVRQAGTHQDWLANVEHWEAADVAVTVIVAHKTSVHDAAVPIAGELCLCPPEVLRSIARRTFDALRHVRAAARGLSDAQLADRLADAFADAGLDNPALLAELGARRIIDG